MTPSRHPTSTPLASALASTVAWLSIAGAAVAGCSSTSDSSVATSSTSATPVSTTTAPTTTAPTTTAPPSPVAVGTSIDAGGVSVTVIRAEVVDAVNNGLASGRFFRIEVTLLAVGGAGAYAPTDFVLEMPDGSQIPPFAYTSGDRLAFGTLHAGQPVTGALAWDVEGFSGPAVVAYTGGTDGRLGAWTVDLGDG